MLRLSPCFLSARIKTRSFGEPVIFAKYQIKFLPSAELNLAAAAAPPSAPRPKRLPGNKKMQRRLRQQQLEGAVQPCPRQNHLMKMIRDSVTKVNRFGFCLNGPPQADG
jgi:hypothetical protein